MVETPAQLQRPRRRVPRWVWFVVVCMALGVMTSVGVAWGIAWRRDSIVKRLFISSWSSFVEDSFITETVDENTTVFGWSVTCNDREHMTDRWFSPFRSSNKPENLERAIQENANDLRPWIESTVGGTLGRRALARHRPLLKSVDAEYVSFAVETFGWPLHSLGLERACTLQQAIDLKRGLYSLSGFHPTGYDNADPNATITDPAFDLDPHYSAIAIGDKLLPTFPLWPGLFANTAIYGGAWAVLIGAPIFLRRWLRARRGGCPQCGYSREGLKADAPCPECGRTAAAAMQ